MKSPFHLSLRTLLVVPYVVLVAALALIGGTLSYHSSRDAIDTWSSQLLIETVERIKQAVDRHVSGSAAVLEVAFPKGVTAPDSLKRNFEALRTRFWLATSVHRDPNNYAYYGDREGRFFGLLRHSESEAELRVRWTGEGPRTIYQFTGIHGQLEDPVQEKRIFDPRERPWFKAARAARRQTWTAIYIDFKTRELVATRARRVNDDAGDFAGVVATDLSLEQVNRFLGQLALSRNGVALVMEKDGKLIGASRGPHLKEVGGERRRLNAAESPAPLVAATYRAVRDLIGPSEDGQARTAVFEGPDGDLVQVGYSRLRDDAGLDWLVAVAVPRSDFQQEVEDNLRKDIGLGVLSAVAVVLLGLFVLSVITRELGRLAEAARRIGEGDYDAELDTKRDDEIGQLNRSFVDMRRRLLTDPLTGVANREAILRRIEERILRHRRRNDRHPFALLFIDLDDFKAINDRFGHDVGDLVLQEIATRIRANVREQDSVARYAGDEFLVLVDSVAFREDGEAIRRHLEQVLTRPLRALGDQAGEVNGGASVGLAIFPDDGLDVETLVKKADEEMYRHKQARRPDTGPASDGD